MIDSGLTPRIARSTFSARVLLCTTCLATSAGAVTLLGSQSAQADRASQSPDAVSQLIEHPQRLRSVDTMRVEFQPIELRRKRGPQTRTATPHGSRVSRKSPGNPTRKSLGQLLDFRVMGVPDVRMSSRMSSRTAWPIVRDSLRRPRPRTVRRRRYISVRARPHPAE
jgi:hypothetical protein